jgi:hypothetical protein
MGTLSMNAAALSDPCTLSFQIEASETDNDVDDDGDGLIDEGTMRMTSSVGDIMLVRDIERCTFSFAGNLLTIEMGSARAMRGGQIHRATVEQSYFMRNK